MPGWHSMPSPGLLPAAYGPRYPTNPATHRPDQNRRTKTGPKRSIQNESRIPRFPLSQQNRASGPSDRKRFIPRGTSRRQLRPGRSRAELLYNSRRSPDPRRASSSPKLAPRRAYNRRGALLRRARRANPRPRHPTGRTPTDNSKIKNLSSIHRHRILRMRYLFSRRNPGPVFEEDYKRANKIPSKEEAIRRVVRRYSMTGRIDQEEMCDLCAAYSDN